MSAIISATGSANALRSKKWVIGSSQLLMCVSKCLPIVFQTVEATGSKMKCPRIYYSFQKLQWLRGQDLNLRPSGYELERTAAGESANSPCLVSFALPVSECCTSGPALVRKSGTSARRAVASPRSRPVSSRPRQTTAEACVIIAFAAALLTGCDSLAILEDSSKLSSTYPELASVEELREQAGGYWQPR